MPERIQRRRTRGWHIPAGAVNVCRPTRWGNPYAVGSCDATEHDGTDMLCWCPPGSPAHSDLLRATRHWHVYDRRRDNTELARSTTNLAAVLLAVDWFARDLLAGKLAVSVADVRRELADKDLVCWCPLDQACHANVLLTVANCGHCWCEPDQHCPDQCCYCTPLRDGETYAARPCVGDPDGDLPVDDEDGRRIETVTTTRGLL